MSWTIIAIIITALISLLCFIGAIFCTKSGKEKWGQRHYVFFGGAFLIIIILALFLL